MNVIVELADEYVYKDYWPWLHSFPLDTPFGVFLKSTITLAVGAEIGFFFVAGVYYYFVCVLWKDYYFPNRLDKEYNVKMEMIVTTMTLPFMSVYTTILIFPEFFGRHYLYDNITDRGYGYWIFRFDHYAADLSSIVFFLVISDWAVYWIHRWLHTPWAYENIHKRHHWFKVCTPFSAYAFHPLDGVLQSVPYHVFPLFFPLHKWTYLTLFGLILLWTVSIHSGVAPIQGWGINGPAHHTIHHSRFKFNYGQYFTFWDKLGGSYMEPEYDWQLDKAKLAFKKTR